MLKEKSSQATIYLLLGVLFWGMAFSFVKEAVRYVDPFSFLAVRFLIAAALLAAVFFPRLRGLTMELLKAGALTGLLLAAAIVTSTIGLQYTSATNAGFITGLNVIMVLVFGALLDRRLPGILQSVSVLLALAGLFLIVVNDEMGFNIGDVWVFAGAVAAALQLMAVGRLAGKMDAGLFSLVQVSTVAVVSLVCGLLVNGEVAVSGDFALWQSILFCAIFATCYMYTVQAQFQRYITEVKTAIIFSFEPVFAALFAVVYLGEGMTLRLLIGGLLIFVAMALSEWRVGKVSGPGRT